MIFVPWCMQISYLQTVCSFQFSLLHLLSRIRAVFNQDQIFPIQRQVSFVHSNARWIMRLFQFGWWSSVAQMVNNLPAMQETLVWSLGQDHPLEKGMATHSSTHAWRIPEESDGLQSMGSQRVGPDWATNTPTHTHKTGVSPSLMWVLGWHCYSQ